MNVTIYHQTSPNFRPYTEQFDRDKFTSVGVLSTDLSGDDALEAIYCRTQNLSAPWNPNAPCRSTSVGDVMEIEGEYYSVAPCGFTRLPQSTNMASSKGFVIYHDTDGVYLGNALGLAFFSMLDPVGQSEAVAFDTRSAAAEHVASWQVPESSPKQNYRFIEVDVTNRGTATMESCVRAGLPAWDVAA